MEQVVKLITETLPVDCVCISELVEKDGTLSLRAGFGYEKGAEIGKDVQLNGRGLAVKSLISSGGIVLNETDIKHRETLSLLAGGRSIKNGICIPIPGGDSESVWGLLSVCRDTGHSFNQADVNFIRAMGEIVSCNVREMHVLDSMKMQLTSIKRAKKQWEATVDALPQLVIALNSNAEIIRVNRTAESWGIGKVNDVGGFSISDLVKLIVHDYPIQKWHTEWTGIWANIHNRREYQWEVTCGYPFQIFQFTLRKVQQTVVSKSHCFAILIIDDITARKQSEELLKRYAEELEKNITNRTLELKQVNEQLQHELQVQKKDKEVLAEFQLCRQQLLHELITAQETERKRIACELHDSIGQSLGATKFKVEELLARTSNELGEQEHSQLTDIVYKIKSVIDEVRHIAMDLRPAMLDDLGVLATLKWFCREFEETYSSIKINQLVDVPESDISQQMKVVIFRIVQEAMNNIAKHANATHVELELYRSVSGLILCISDNGKGFNNALVFDKKDRSCGFNRTPEPCGFGLNSMCERAESTNGCFSVESIPGGGSRVLVVWP